MTIIAHKPTKIEKIFSVTITLIIIISLSFSIIKQVYATDYNECIYITSTADDCMYVIDISDLNNITLADTVYWGVFDEAPHGIHVYDEYVYVVDYSNDEMYVFDASDVTNIVEVDATSDMPPDPLGISIDEDNDIAYISCYGASDVARIVAYNISDPTNVAQLGYWDDDVSELLDSNEWCRFYEDYLYVASTNNENFVVFNVDDYNNIYNMSDLDGDEGASDFRIQKSLEGTETKTYAYLANIWGDGGLAIIDVTNPSSISIVGEYVNGSPDHYCEGIDVYEDIVYLSALCYSGDYDDALLIVDVTDKENPALVNTIYGDSSPNWINSTINAIELINDDILAVLSDDYLSFYDVSTPAYPIFVTSIAYGGQNMWAFGVEYTAPSYGYPYDFILGWIKWILAIVVIGIIVGLAIWIKRGWRR